MRFFLKHILFSLLILLGGMISSRAAAQGSSGTIRGVVKDQSGAVVAGAKVEISSAAIRIRMEATTGSAGDFRFAKVPMTHYRLVVTAGKFALYTQTVQVQSPDPVVLEITLKTEQSPESSAQGPRKNGPAAPKGMDLGFLNTLPLNIQSSSLSSLVALTSPGVIADSNGLLHGAGDHAQNSFLINGSPMTDQTSKVFSGQAPVEAVESLQIVSGETPAEFGKNTSPVIKVATPSGLGTDMRTGTLTATYGTFGTLNAGFSLAMGNERWGNFIAGNGLNTHRFLDTPEFQAVHARGNQENGFDRLDFQPSTNNSFHLDGGYTRTWFQVPNSFEALTAFTSPQDQKAQMRTYAAAPSWTHMFNPSMLLTLGGFARYDDFHYYPSSNLLADLTETAAQDRSLLNAGVRLDFSYVRGVHNVKVGGLVQHTLLDEKLQLGLTDPAVNDPCITLNGAGAFVPAGDRSITDPSQCAGKGFQPNIASNPNAVNPFVPLLGCLDLTRLTPASGDGCAGTQSALFVFSGDTDIKEYAAYVQDAISAGNWTFNLGLRGDWYRGLSHGEQAQPRAGVSYNFKPTKTVLRGSYARLYETPFNENLVVASAVTDPVLGALFGRSTVSPIEPGQRNEFRAGLQQTVGKYTVIDADYILKYTHNAYDFRDFLNTPIFFPAAWHNSKISGPVARVNVPNFHGVTAFVVLGSVSARFFNPQVGGLGASPAAAVFRIDHDQVFQETSHVQYQPWKRGPWLGFNWRYDSGLVAGPVPVATDSTKLINLTGLSADQQLQAGLFCGSLHPTLTTPLITCAPAQYGSTLLSLPSPGTQNADHNPARIAPRHLFDASIGDDNLFFNDRYKWSLRVTAVNFTNKKALYNFLSPFSGTHYVTPRSASVELAFHF